MAVIYPSPEAVPAEMVQAVKAAFMEAAAGDVNAALEKAVAEILFLLPGVSNGMLRMGAAPDVAEK